MWFLGAILLAIASSSLMVVVTRPEATEGPVRTVSRTVASRLARDWDDPQASEAYVERLRESMGLDLRVRRDPESLPAHVRRMGHPGAVAFTADGKGLIPVSRHGVVVGAVEFDAGYSPPRFWRGSIALGVALLVLAMAAVRVSRQLARPIEHVASVAEKFGAGDLSARTNIVLRPRRWVAEEVQELGLAFDRMADRIEGVVRDQRELLAAISHELRSPLGRARVALEIARDRAGGSAPLDAVEQNLGEVDAILGDLLAAARAGLSDVRKERTALVPWLRARIAAESTPPAIELSLGPGVDVVEVAIDAALLGRALHNLFANARNHGHPSQVALDVRVELGAGRVRVMVSDRGPGFPVELLDRAFEAFVRGDAARTPQSGTGGTGLGLALVRRIAEAHGGTAFARNLPPGNQPVEGAEVGFELPCLPRQESSEIPG